MTGTELQALLKSIGIHLLLWGGVWGLVVFKIERPPGRVRPVQFDQFDQVSLVGTQSVLPAERPAFRTGAHQKKLMPFAERVAAAAEEPSLTAGLQEQRQNQYLIEIAGLIAQHRHYPRISFLNQEEGTVEVGLEISPSGEITKINLVHPSGFQLLDRAAMNALAELKTVPPPPGELSGRPLRVPIRFEIIKLPPLSGRDGMMESGKPRE
jgi:TonB family protein